MENFVENSADAILDKADAWRRWDHRASDTQCATCVWFRISDAFDWCELVHQKRNPSDFCSKWKGME